MAPFPVAFFIKTMTRYSFNYHRGKKKYVKYIVGHYTIFLEADKMIVELCKMHKNVTKKRHYDRNDISWLTK